jgi:hypothetical protein
MTLRPDRGLGGRHEGALRLGLWRLPSGPPDGADRLLVRVAEWRHKEIGLTAVELLQYLDTKSERVRKR